MFCFDKAYSLKCLAADKQGSFCGNRLQLTWERSRFPAHTLRQPALPSCPDGPPPCYSLLVVINLTHHENKTGSSGTTGCYVGEGICASQPPKICQRLPIAFRRNSMPLRSLTGPGPTRPADISPLTIHTRSPT